VNDPTGKRTGLVKVFQDLTELEALREQVRRKDRLAAIGEMAATVAHEIRNPLGGIRGFATLLQRDVEASDPRARLVEKILAGVKSLEEVVNELLEYTRPVHLDRKRIACAELVEGALASLDPRSSAIRIENLVPEELAVLADEGKMRQVLLNILLNAQQSISGSGTITVSGSERGGDVEVRISDTGCGISTGDLERVFSPFYTTKDKGAGLGLAIAAKIVENHGGTITVTSEPGQGSTFCVRLRSWGAGKS
jgi:signal transduction histidine kinase